MREIRYMQNHTRNCIPKLPFARVVREITKKVATDRGARNDAMPYRYRAEALMALQVSSEWILNTSKGEITRNAFISGSS